MKLNHLLKYMILAGSIAAISVPGLAVQGRGNQGGQRSSGGGGQRNSNSGSQRGNSGRQSSRGNSGSQQKTPPPSHAPREVVRTPTYVPRSTGTQRTSGARNSPPAQIISRQGGGNRTVYQTPRRTITPNTPGIKGQRTFTKTANGRHYDNGLNLRKGILASTTWQKRYFPSGHYHYPNYRTSWVAGSTFFSPFGFFYGVCVPFIGTAGCGFFPPSVTFIDLPAYNGVNCSGFTDDDQDNLISDPNLETEEPGLLNAMDCLTETFQGGNVDGLATLVSPNMQIAIYLRGQYQYSMAPNDYIDVARDAIKAISNVSFTLNYLHQRSPNVFSVGGKQIYTDRSGNEQVAWVSYVLQDISGQWTLTQVGNAPGIYRSPSF